MLESKLYSVEPSSGLSTAGNLSAAARALRPTGTAKRLWRWRHGRRHGWRHGCKFDNFYLRSTYTDKYQMPILGGLAGVSTFMSFQGAELY